MASFSIEINGSRLGGGVATSGALGAAAGGGAIKDDSEDEGFHDANSRPNSNEKVKRDRWIDRLIYTDKG